MGTGSLQWWQARIEAASRRSSSLRPGRELGGVDPGVVGDGVVEVVEQVL
jgi:hypothetical protein